MKKRAGQLPPGFRNEGLLGLHDAFWEHVPQVYSWLTRPDEFGELRLKARPDGTVIAVAKGYGSDGGPIVCFGSGYDALSALQGLEGALTANRWRPDKPWTGNGKEG